MKRKLILLLCAILAIGIFAFFVGCGNKSDEITVITRENGSGTRSAFIELTGVEQKDSQGNKFDKTTKKAEEANSTAVVITQVSNNKRAIGYISFGSLNDKVKAVDYEGVAASADNIKKGTYALSRPFNVVYKADNDNKTLIDFLSYLKSRQAAAVISDNDFIAPDTSFEYEKSQVLPSERIRVNGSSSVQPLMEKLIESYCKISGVAKSKFDFGKNDSTSGINGAINGTYDLGMASRELKSSEAAVLERYVLATDGIAVIVNKKNSINNVTKTQIRDIYTGAVVKWGDLGITIE